MRKPYLIFSWHGRRYGIEANLVKEMFLLPELTSIVEAPNDIVGILNLRSQIVAVMHLDLRLGLQMQECRLSDGVVVFAWEGLSIGMIVNDVHEVQMIPPEAIDTELPYGRVSVIDTAFVAGIAEVDEETTVLLNPEALVRHPEAVAALIADGQEGSDRTLRDFYQLCCPQATPKDREIFRSRAKELKTSESEEATGLIPLAVIDLNDEYFGLDLQSIREFIDVGKITPVPCCPSHITGNINVRGEIVTLTDIRQALKLPLANADKISKAVIVEVNEIVAGLPVDAVFDVAYFHPSDITASSVASDEETYLRGTVPYSEKMLSILDLPKMLTQGRLEVNEAI